MVKYRLFMRNTEGNDSSKTAHILKNLIDRVPKRNKTKTEKIFH